jgi:hypothetical protein
MDWLISFFLVPVVLTFLVLYGWAFIQLGLPLFAWMGRTWSRLVAPITHVLEYGVQTRREKAVVWTLLVVSLALVWFCMASGIHASLYEPPATVPP